MWVAGTLLAGLRRLPVRWVHGLARAVGSFAYMVGARRQVTLENLRQALPQLTELERRRIARATYRNMALAAAEALTAERLSDQELEHAVSTENWAPMDQAVAAGKGVLVATAHFGSWELFGEVMSRKGLALNAVVRPLAGAFNAQIVESRRRSGMKVILQRGALRGMLKAVRQGEVVAQLVDQVLPAKSGVFVPFFGRPACTTPALSMAAIRTGAPVMVVLAAREEGRLRVFVEGPIPVPQTGDRATDLREHTAQITAVIERYVRRYPDQWLWLHRRWKVQPQQAI
jgi:KDO2-lipid IV(A) lauroyltransferase